MVHELQTRYEHSQSLADAEKFKAIRILTELGLLIPVSELETYHGRVGRKDAHTAWGVDPTFSNGGNNTGNFNVNDRPTLYTGSRADAEDFASRRLLEASWRHDADTLQPEVHQIVVEDPDATVINLDFDVTNLDKLDKERYIKALKALLIPLTEGSPVDFFVRHDTQRVDEELKRQPRLTLTRSEIAKVAVDAGVNEGTVLQLASAHNALSIAAYNPAYLASLFLHTAGDYGTAKVTIGDETLELPVNMEYVQRYMRAAHIVGVKDRVFSVTVGRKIKSISFFDLEKTYTSGQLEAKRASIWAKLGSLASESAHIPKAFKSGEKIRPLLGLLEDPHTKPETLVAAAKKIDGYKEIFEADAGNWEGFSLEQHVETVLRNFDENFADRVPVGIIPLMRLAILAHDLGKPEAAAKGRKHLQDQYNAQEADKFLTKLGVNDRLKKLILAIVGEGEALALQVARTYSAESAVMAMRNFAVRTLQEYNGSREVAEEQVQAFTELCQMFMICDGGAYTSMAVTRSKVGRHRNAPSFNDTFSESLLGLSKRGIGLRRTPNDRPAPRSLTPNPN